MSTIGDPVTLLDRGPHTVMVFPQEELIDSYGNVVQQPAKTGVEIRGCLVTPITNGDGRDDNGQFRLFRILARDAPLGPWSELEWQGIRMHVISGPHHFNASRNTRHVEATLRENR